MSISLIFSGRTHKQSETISDCQDYYQSNSEKDCFAIADGASQSFYPSLWAELLVNHFCKNPEINQENWEQWLELIQEKWLSEVTQKVEQARNQGDASWVTNHNRLKVYQHSATSTFIGLRFLENKVQVSIVGDSCLFIIKNNHSTNKNSLLGTYLIKESKDFGNRPEYFASYKKDNHFKPDLFNIPLEAEANSEKVYFILATDALSEFIFKCIENEKPILQKLLDISQKEDFEKFVLLARRDETIGMKNDDVTLMILELSDFTINPSDLSSISEPNRNIENTSQDQISGVDDIPTDEKESQDDDSSSSDIKENDSPPDKNTEKTVERNLKKQRLVLGCLTFLLSLFIIMDKLFSGNDPNKPIQENPPSAIDNQTLPSTDQPITINPPSATNNINPPPIDKFKPKFIELKKETFIYKDKELKEENLILSLSNPARVLIIEQGDNWIKFQIDLYAYESLLEKCDDCQKDEIKIKPNDNIRMWTDFSSNSNKNNIFGQLKNVSKFQKLEFNYVPEWYKFEFEGYIKKDEISSKK